MKNFLIQIFFHLGKAFFNRGVGMLPDFDIDISKSMFEVILQVFLNIVNELNGFPWLFCIDEKIVLIEFLFN